MNKELYLMAQKDENLRENFGKKIKFNDPKDQNSKDDEILIKCASGIIYDCKLTDFLILCLGASPGQKNPLYLGPLFFTEKKLTYTDKKGLIRYKAGQWLEDIFNCEKNIMNFKEARKAGEQDLMKYFYAQTQLRGLANQTKNLFKENFSENYKKDISTERFSILKGLKELGFL